MSFSARSVGPLERCWPSKPKRALLLTLAKKYADGAGELIAVIPKQNASPLRALRGCADCMAGMAASPAAGHTFGFAWLVVATDPFHARPICHILGNAVLAD